MSKTWFLPNNTGERTLWLNNFAAKLPNYSTKYGIAAADVTDIGDGAEYYSYWVEFRNQYQEYQKKLTQFITEISSGSTSSTPPAPPTLPPPPTAVPPGLITRATSIGNRIKKHNLYTTGDGEDLGLEGTEKIGPGPDVKPAFSVRPGSGGHPEIVWVKQGMDGIEIWKDSGTGTFTLLDIDLTPNFTDALPLPAGGAVWRYKTIYRKDSAQYGQWSDVVSINVG